MTACSRLGAGMKSISGKAAAAFLAFALVVISGKMIFIG